MGDGIELRRFVEAIRSLLRLQYLLFGFAPYCFGIKCCLLRTKYRFHLLETAAFGLGAHENSQSEDIQWRRRGSLTSLRSTNEYTEIAQLNIQNIRNVRHPMFAIACGVIWDRTKLNSH